MREQEAQSKGDAARHGLEQPSARHPVRNASEHDSARQVGETARDERSQVRKRAEPVGLTEHGKGTLLGLVGWLVVEWGSK